eukprot:3188604-Pleurochrysis_carterae.AAC.1
MAEAREKAEAAEVARLEAEATARAEEEARRAQAQRAADSRCELCAHARVLRRPELHARACAWLSFLRCMRMMHERAQAGGGRGGA